MAVYALWFFVGILLLFRTIGLEPSLRTTIRDWLDSSTFKVSTIEGIATGGFNFAFLVEDDHAKKVVVVGHQNERITFEITLSPLAGDDRTRLNQLTPNQRLDTVSRLRLALIHHGVQFVNLQNDLSGPITISLPSAIPRNRLEFLRALFLIRDSIEVYRETLGLEIRDQEVSTPDLPA